MKPYQQVPIRECHEPLVAIPLAAFVVEQPHPYIKLAAPYGNKSPYYLRQGILERLLLAQKQLQKARPDWRIQIFDAYRPIEVQQFMVDYTFTQTVQETGLTPETLTEVQRQTLLAQVYQFWATPSLDPATPPPHSTGAALDVTLVDAKGQIIDMGSPIDEMSPRSYPDHYAPASDESHEPTGQASNANHAQFHQNRLVLKQAMTSVGFEQHPQEWWHFSYGDQFWAWLTSQKQPNCYPIARYGAI
jgi:zinc D-Ala-D-Ala dipeptidase